MKCGETKLCSNILLHISKCSDKKNNFALYALHRLTDVLLKWQQIDVHTIHFPFKSQLFFIPFISVIEKSYIFRLQLRVWSVDTLQTQKMCLYLELYLRQKINYSQFIHCFYKWNSCR